MANRVLTGLSYIQAAEFVIGANHPDGLSDVANRPLTEAWGLLSPQIEDTIKIEYKDKTHVTVLAGGMKRLPSGAVVVIDTPIDLDISSSPGLHYLWVGLVGSTPTFDWSVSATVAPSGIADAALTRMTTDRWQHSDSNPLQPFIYAGGWCFRNNENLYVYSGTVAVGDGKKEFTIATAEIPITATMLDVRYTLTPTNTATLSVFADMVNDTVTSPPAATATIPAIEEILLSGTTVIKGRMVVPLRGSQSIYLQTTSGTVTVVMETVAFSY